jgi:hypothetical protein
MMDITFGILTGGGSETSKVKRMIDRIRSQKVPNYEIITVGPVNILDTKVVGFDEKIRGLPWITKKKNIITAEAKYPYVVYMHDYMYLHDGWYENWVKWLSWGRDFEVANNAIYTMEGDRHSDWIISPYDMWKACPELKDTWDLLLPYDVTHLTPLMYISGGFWIAKKSFMEQYPQNEDLGWGESEDVEWSQSIRNHIEFKINPNSKVQLMKPRKWAPGLIKPETIQLMIGAKEKGIIE